MSTSIERSESSLAMMNMAAILVIVFALLFIFLQLAQKLKEKEELLFPSQAPPSPPLQNQPPIFQFSEAEGYSFPEGRADLSADFKMKLQGTILPDLIEKAKMYNCDIIDCIGHTDEQRVLRTFSNLDDHLLQQIQQPNSLQLVPGSNVDLGLMRCWEVIKFLKEDGRLKDFILYGYSAGPAILPNGNIALLGQEPRDDKTRRRIEIRLRSGAHRAQRSDVAG